MSPTCAEKIEGVFPKSDKSKRNLSKLLKTRAITSLMPRFNDVSLVYKIWIGDTSLRKLQVRFLSNILSLTKAREPMSKFQPDNQAEVGSQQNADVMQKRGIHCNKVDTLAWYKNETEKKNLIGKYFLSDRLPYCRLLAVTRLSSVCSCMYLNLRFWLNLMWFILRANFRHITIALS